MICGNDAFVGSCFEDEHGAGELPRALSAHVSYSVLSTGMQIGDRPEWRSRSSRTRTRIQCSLSKVPTSVITSKKIIKGLRVSRVVSSY